jgi:hypothetical protein
MREVWNLPEDNLLINIGVEWLLHLLHHIKEDQRAMTLMLLWRIWFAHNEVTHEKTLPPIEGSRQFLRSYWESLMLIKQHPMADLEKGKMVISHTEHPTGYVMNKRENKVRQQWMPPARGMLKLNVDGFYANDTTAGAGAVLRDHVGAVIFATCWQVEHCIDATEAELAAMELGIAQAMTVTPDRIVLESNCADLDTRGESTDSVRESIAPCCAVW